MKRQFCELRRIMLLFALVPVVFLPVAPQTSLAQQKLKTALAPPTTEKVNDSRIITISTELVSLTVTVTDKRGRYVDGLDRGAFAVYEDDVRRRSASSATATRPPPSAWSLMFQAR